MLLSSKMSIWFVAVALARTIYYVKKDLGDVRIFFLQKQVVRCCLEHAASVAKTFITSDAVVVDIKGPEQAPAPANPMGGGSGTCGLPVASDG